MAAREDGQSLGWGDWRSMWMKLWADWGLLDWKHCRRMEIMVSGVRSAGRPGAEDGARTVVGLGFGARFRVRVLGGKGR